MDTTEADKRPTGHSMSFLMYFAGYLVTLFVFGQICLRVSSTSCYKPLAHLIASIVAAIMFAIGSDVRIFFLIDIKHLITIFYTPILFRIVYDLDIGFFRKQLAIKVLFAIVMTSVCSLGIGAGMVLLTGSRWTWKIIFIYGFALGSIDYLDTTVSVLNMASFKSMLLVLVQVESIIGAELCRTILELSFGLWNGLFVYWYQVVAYLVRMYAGGMMYGFFVGRLLHVGIDTYLDSIDDIGVFIIVSPICVYYIGEHVLYVSGNVGVLLYSYSFALYKARIPLRVGKNLNKINFAIARLCQSLMIYFATVPFLFWTIHHFDRAYLKEYLCLFIITLAIRFCLLFFTMPIMKRFNRRHSLSNLFVMSLIAKKGPLQVIYFLLILNEEMSFEMGCFCAPFTFFLVTTSLLITPEMYTLVTSLCGLVKRNETFYNLLSCIHQIEKAQMQHTSMFRMNSVYQDVNWMFVSRTLRLSSKVRVKMDQAESIASERREVYCKNCEQVVAFPFNNLEFTVLMQEANKAIIKAHKISFMSQYEKGRFQKPVVVILLTFVEYSMASQDFSLDPMLFQHFIHKETMIVKIKAAIKIVDMGPPIPRPRKKRRHIFYKIIMHYSYEMVLLFVLVCSIFLGMVDCVMMGRNDTVFQLKGVVIFIFFCDCVMKITAYSHIYVKEGFKRYFCNSWDQFDFLVLIILCVDMAVIKLCAKVEQYELIFCNVKGVSSIQLFKLLKVVFIAKRYEKKIVTFLDKLIGLRIMLAIDIGEAMINSYDEIIHILPKLVEHDEICDVLTRKAKADRLIIKTELMNRTSERDWVMVTCKTHQMIRNCLFAMKTKIEELWLQGYIDDFEFEKLKNSQETCLQTFFKLNSITKPSDEDLISNLGYMPDETVSYYCYVNSYKMKFRKDEEILKVGNRIDGLMIMTSGLVNVEYAPLDEDIYVRYGALPGIDDLDEELLFQPRTYCIMCGNTLGEMGLLTRRPYHCRATTIEDSEFLVIPKAILDDASCRKNVKCIGIYPLMWTHMTMKLINSILWKTKPFEGSTEDEVMMHAFKGFFPDLHECSGVERSKSIEDIVLIEGVVYDGTTMEVFLAPCYLPRHVKYIHFRRSTDYMVNPKLFFIPLDVSLTASILEKLNRTARRRSDADYDKKWAPGPGDPQDIPLTTAKEARIWLELPPTLDDDERAMRDSMGFYLHDPKQPYPGWKVPEKSPPPPPPRSNRTLVSTQLTDTDAYLSEGPPAKRARLWSRSDLQLDLARKVKED